MLLAEPRLLAAATLSSMAFLEKAIAWAPSASAPLVAAVAAATTASRFSLEWAFRSFIEARDFSIPSLNACEPAAEYCSTVVFRVSAALAIWSLLLARAAPVDFVTLHCNQR